MRKSRRGSRPAGLRSKDVLDRAVRVVEALESRWLFAATAPYISEFVAGNASGITDEDGARSDWIEIYNPTSVAVNLNNWSLTDDVADKQKWLFPSVTLDPGGFLVVFADDKNRRVATAPLHTNFKLSSTGEYLGLYKPDQSVAYQFSPSFPAQTDDVSYGAHFTTADLVLPGAPSQTLIPTDATLGSTWTQPSYTPPANWVNGPTGVGFGLDVAGLKATTYVSKVNVGSTTDADTVINTPSLQASVTSEIAPYINYFNTGDGTNFGADRTFPGLTINSDVDNFVLLATGTVTIPTSGPWSFGVNSDDGFRLQLTRNGQTFTSEYPNPRGPSDTIQTFNLPAAGDYALRLVFYENGGGSSVEMFAASGTHPGFDASFRLVGDTAGGGLAVHTPADGSTGSGGSAVVGTDVGTAMRNVNATAYVRVPFTIASPNTLESLLLTMRYDDGFVAYINGTEIARRNAPTTPAFNSAATTERPQGQALIEETINVSAFRSALVPGNNVLAIQGLNATAADTDFLVLPQLVATLSSDPADVRFITTPTPGAPNASTFGNFIAPVTFSLPHGYYSSAQTLTLSTTTPGATIRYTTDGSDPTDSTGTVYAGPISISGTTTLKASAFKATYSPPAPVAQSYFFLADIKTQSATGAPPAGWPSGSVNGQSLDYGMDPDIVNSPTWGPQMDAALTAIPSLSIVTSVPNLFDPSTGIYTHASNEGSAWERPASVELIDPSGAQGQGFTINAGLRIRGGYSRSGDNPKHSFRLFFNDDYGGKLNYPLFGSEGVSQFKGIDLRTAQNYSWSFEGNPNNNFIAEVSNRDTERALNDPYTRSRFYNLYIDGQYWGLYQTEERPEAEFASSYFGGPASNYDVMKAEAGPYDVEATDGNANAWNDLWNLASQGFSSNSAYYRVLGKNAQGVDDPSIPVYVDPKNLIDYMITTYWSGNLDAPISAFLGNERVNNFFAIRDRTLAARQGWQFFQHDGEHTLLNPDENRIGPWSAGNTENEFNPQWLHQQLMQNAEYRMQFIDRVQQLMLTPGGVLTPAAATARFQSRAAEINQAIIAESARWGDAKTGTPLTKDNWQNAINNIVNNYMPVRTGKVVAQFQAAGWFPNTAAPAYAVNGIPSLGATLSAGDSLSLLGQPGLLYYTTDGSDPRLPGGGVSASAIAYPAALITPNSTWKYLVAPSASAPPATWTGNSFTDSSWSSGNAELGYGDGDEATTVGFGPSSTNKYITSYFRKSFNVASTAAYSSLTLSLKRDDGAVVYINGQEVARSNMPTGAVTWSTLASSEVTGADESAFTTFTIPSSALIAGANVLAVEVHQRLAVNEPDLSFDAELTGPRLSLPHSTRLKTRVLNGSEWSALNDAVFVTDPSGTAANLSVTEVNYNPYQTELSLGETAADNNDYEFVELLNRGSSTVSLKGVHFTAGAVGQLPDDAILAPGQRGVIVRNVAAFRSRYGSGPFIVGTYTDSLDGSGELVTLVDATNATIASFTYDDAAPWAARADGKGSTLELINIAGSYSDPANWRASAEFEGTPGAAGTGPTSGIVINEVMTNGSGTQKDSIELYNPTGSSINVGGWYLSDNSDAYRKFRIPDNTVVTAGGYILFDESAFNPGNGVNVNDFALSSSGEDVYLLAANPTTGRFTRFADEADFGAAEQGASFGRYPNGSGELYPMATYTPGAANSTPRIGSVIINEVMYNPASGGAEFIELRNLTAASVPLYDPSIPANTWKFTSGINFTFPANAAIPASSYALVVGIDPNVFRSQYNVPAGVPIYGPFTGDNLANAGDDIVLSRPATPTSTSVPYIQVDRLPYGATSPWVTTPNGGGPSLARVGAASPTPDASNWAAEVNGGSPGRSNFAVAGAATVKGRFLFYNNSKFDSFDAGANGADDAAIAADKSPLLSGATSVSGNFANYSSYSLGINGVMIDIAGLPTSAITAAADFTFRVGNNNTPAGWNAPLASPTITVRPGAGTAGSDRIELVWPDGTIKNQWLQVMVLANARTGLTTPDVFYFGNAVGETGNDPANANVDSADYYGVRDHLRSYDNPAPATWAWDMNRDGITDITDVMLVRASAVTGSAALQLITLQQAPVQVPVVKTGTKLTPTPLVFPPTTKPPVVSVPTPSSRAIFGVRTLVSITRQLKSGWTVSKP